MKKIIKLWEEKGSIPLKFATWCTGTLTRFIYTIIVAVYLELFILWLIAKLL